jgi:hypothetical protein
MKLNAPLFAAHFTLLCAILNPSLSGQSGSAAGDLRGTITDQASGTIANARVTATDASRNTSRSTTTSSDGAFALPLLPPGTYQLKVEASNFATLTTQPIEIRVGDLITLPPIKLSVESSQTSILVMGEAASIETQRTQQSDTITNRQILNLPVNRRSYLDLALLTPGVTETTTLTDGTDYRVVQAPQSGLSFGGTNGRGSNFLLDGSAHYSTAGGVRLTVSQEAVAEFQVNRNSFAPEFGGGQGGAVNIVTKAGSNELHGTIFGFLRERAIQARNYFDPAKSGFTRTQSGLAVGGPVRRDRAFFFGGFEALVRNETNFVTITQDPAVFNQPKPSQQTLINFLRSTGNPQLVGLAITAQQQLIPANSPFLLRTFRNNSGAFPFGEDSYLSSFRMDYRLSDTHNLFWRFNHGLSDRNNAQLGALFGYDRGRAIANNGGTFMVSDVYLFSPSFFMESRLMGARDVVNVTTIDPNGPGLEVAGFGTFGRDIFLPSRTLEWHVQWLQNFTKLSGKHNFKFGYDINPVRIGVESQTFFAGRFSFGEQVPLGLLLNTVTNNPNFATQLGQTLVQLGQPGLVPTLNEPISALQAFALGLPTFYQQGFGDPTWNGTTARFNFYAQDEYRISRRFTLNYGIRYELENNPNPVSTDTNNFAPRVGLAWTPSSSGKTVIRAAYGLFYGPNISPIANVASTLSGTQIAQTFVPLSGAPGVINPQTGRPVASSDVYQTLLRQGVIGNRAIQAADLAQFGIRPGPNAPLSVVFGIVDKWSNPFSQQASLEVQQNVAGWAVSAAYNFNRGHDLPRILDRNLYYGPRRADGQPTFQFFNPLIFQRNIFEPTAKSFYHAGMLQVQRRFSKNFLLNAHYTWSKAIDEVTDFNTDYQPHDQLNAAAERALSAFNQSHRFVGSALFTSTARNSILQDWNLAPIVIANTGRPFNILAGVDNLNDRRTTTHRPLGAGRNIGQGPGFFTADLRLSRRFTLTERWNLEFIAEGFNLLNRTNFRTVNNVAGNITVNQLPADLTGRRGEPSRPFSFTSAQDPRQFQFGLKLFF